MRDGAVEGSNLKTDGNQFVLRAHQADAHELLDALETARDTQFIRTPFQRRTFLDSFYRNLPDNCTPLVVSVRENDSGRLAMVLPLIKRNSSVLSYIEPADLGLSDYVAPVLADWFNPTPREMERIWTMLRRILPSADILSFKKVPAVLENGKVNPLTLLPHAVEMGTATKLLDLSGPECASHYQRSGLYKDGMKKLRKLRTLGEVEFRMAQSRDDALQLFDALVEQRTARFQTLDRPDPLMDSKVRAFYSELIADGVPKGAVMFGGLYLDGFTCAIEVRPADLGLVEGETHHGIMTTMVGGDIQRQSPGTIVFMLMLDETMARQLRYYDIGVGEFFYKSRLKGVETSLHESHEALSLRGRAALANAKARRMIRLGLSRYPRLRKPVEGFRQRLRRLRKLSLLAPVGLMEFQSMQAGLGLL